MDTIAYDIEIVNLAEDVKGGWGNPKGMSFASAVTYSYDKDQYSFFLHLQGMTKLLELLNKNRTISFHGIGFDSKILMGKNRKIIHNRKKAGVYLSGAGVVWEEYDIFVQCLKSVYNIQNDLLACKRISPGGLKLDDIAKATIGAGKNGHGADAPILYQQKKYDELLEYNFNDTRITKKLYDFIVDNRFVFSKDKKTKIKIPYII